MEIGGFQRVSLIDYPGRIASIVFVTDCNMRCPFCYVSDLVLRNYKKLRLYPEEEVIQKLRESRGFVEAVDITGGEPTLWPDLIDFIRRCKDLGLLVKLDTNGSNPGYVRRLLEEKLVDYIAMDIKTELRPVKYDKALGIRDESVLERVEESINLIRNSGIEYEFRTTAVPGLVEIKDLVRIAERIKGARAYYIQQFLPKNTIDPSFLKVTPYSGGELLGACESIRQRKLVQKCEVRGVRT